ncbi:MAG TPA: ABC transporter ATP-binding protein [Patescibacteria group bacterium]|nr:ABC transporter ATP-binding protein [Patescibacteria group bacterium]
MLKIKNLTVNYSGGNQTTLALCGVSLTLEPGGSLGIMGESGAGKTTLVQAIIGLLGASARREGTIYIAGQNQVELSCAEWRRQLGKKIALIPQASQQVLNPVRTVGHQMVEHIRLHSGADRTTSLTLAASSLREVGLNEEHLQRYPHQLSGGQRQRAVVALVCSVSPDLIIADEATHALDVATQEQVLAYLQKKNCHGGATLMVIGHNPQVIGRLCRQVAVFNQGLMVEWGDTAQVLINPRHPFTQAMMAAYRSTGERLVRMTQPVAVDLQREGKYGNIDSGEAVQNFSSRTAILAGS